MNCDMELHEGLIELGDVVCPFCKRTLEDSDEKPRDRSAKYDLCCDCQDTSSIMMGCSSVGVVESFKDTKRRENMLISMRIDTE